MRINIDNIKERKERSIQELRALYRKNVDNNISETAMSLFSPRELKRHLCISIYKESVKFKKNARTRTIEQLMKLLNLSKRTIERYCPPKKQDNEDN